MYKRQGFTCTPMKLETAGTQAIRVYYGQKETSFSVVVQEDPIEILAYRVEKAYQDASVLQSAFSVSFTTNVAFQDATLEIDGMSAECPMRNSTEGMQSFDRKYFSKPSYLSLIHILLCSIFKRPGDCRRGGYLFFEFYSADQMCIRDRPDVF